MFSSPHRLRLVCVGLLFALLPLTPLLAQRAPSKKVLRGIDRALQDYTKSMREQDLDLLERCFDVDGFVEAMVEAVEITREREGELERLTSIGILESVDGSTDLVDFSLLRVHLAANGRTATVYVDGTSSEGEQGPVKILMRKSSSRWVLTDVFDLGTGLLLHLSFASNEGDPLSDDLSAGVNLLFEVADEYYAEDWVGLSQTLEELAELDLPLDLRVSQVYWRAMMARSLGQIDEALRLFKQCREMDPLDAMSAQSAAVMLSSEERYAEALLEARSLWDIMGAAPFSSELLGDCLLNLEQPDEARAVYASGLDLAPANTALLSGFLLTHPTRDAAKARLQAANEIDGEAWEGALVAVLVRQQWSALRLMSEALLELAPDSIMGWRVLIYAQLEAEQPAEAIETALEAMRLAPDNDGFDSLLARAIWESEDTLENSRRAPDREMLVESLASRYMFEGDAENLERLYAIHAADHDGELPRRAWLEAGLQALRFGSFEADEDNRRAALKALAAFEAAGEPSVESPAFYALRRQHLKTAANLGKLDVALRIATEFETATEDPYYRAVVHVLRRDVDAALEALAACEQLGYGPGIFDDEEICADAFRAEPAYLDWWGQPSED